LAASKATLSLLSKSDAFERQLVALYSDASKELVKTIAAKRAKGSLASFERSMLTDVMRTLDKLSVDLRDHAKQLEGLAEGGADIAREAVQGVRRAASGVAFGSTYKAAARAIADNMVANLSEAHAYVGRRLADQWREVGLQAIANAGTQGLTLRQAQKLMVQRVADGGLGAFKDSKGREWRLSSYAEMVVRTSAREASNTGMIMELEALDNDLVRITTHVLSCGICAPYAGRVYSISGRDTRYPALRSIPGFSSGYWVIHPNCRHICSPYVEALADDPEKDRRESNRPFKDERSRAEIEAYERDQAKKRARAVDRRQWEAYLAVLPNDTPRSFSAFRAMKRANSKRYQELQQLYREMRRKIGPKPKPAPPKPPAPPAPKVPTEAAIRAERVAAIRLEASKVPLLDNAPAVAVNEMEAVCKVGTMVQQEATRRASVLLSSPEHKAKIDAAEARLSEALAQAKELEAAANAAKAAYDTATLDLRLAERITTSYIEKSVPPSLIDDAYAAEEAARKVANERFAEFDVASRAHKQAVSRVAQASVDRFSLDKIDADYLEVMREIRPMSGGKVKYGIFAPSKGKYRDAMDAATEYFPTSWFDEARSAIDGKIVGRGYCVHNSRSARSAISAEICLSGDDVKQLAEVARHEFGHYFSAERDLWKVERAFYNRRTHGLSLERLYAGKNEWTRKDQFLHPYMGKDYRYERADAVQRRKGVDPMESEYFELITMGTQGVFQNEWNNDADFVQFILGVLAAL
jgi:hypothetical protein